MSNPLVSIIMPCYNRANKISNAIESILNQIYLNWELIVVDDGSSDNTKLVVSKFLCDKRIQYVELDKNYGVSKARNEGLKRSKGDYISFLDSDDEWINYHLDNTMKVLLHEKLSISLSLWRVDTMGKLQEIDKINNGVAYFNEVIEELNPRVGKGYYVFKKGIFEYSAIEYFYFYHINTLVFKKSLLKDNMAFDEALYNCEDSDLILRLISGNELVFIKNYHSIYHQSDDGIYSFIDHASFDIDTINNLDKGCVEKIVRIEINKIHAKFKVLQFFNYENSIMSYNKFEELILDYISKKYVFISYICSVHLKVYCISYLEKAIQYCNCMDEKLFLLNLLKEYKMRKFLMNIDSSHMNHW
ncbi:glycosyltransferase family 2 protein [Lachnotalea glycerini]|uniref:Glycosyltransferase n=1 Tax=Lachnotalea glycerini TaxID=1763509 RepID=A0A371JH01_9FIRM|nr:glycosyltransferase family 2 protein [Lachnotalea glycerini]RDY32019.1 glycosyltransferase [Lachnotalea glycerini]